MPITMLCLAAGITGFIAGMTVELFANNRTLKDTKEELKNSREELKNTKDELKIMQQQLRAAGKIEVIEITDNRVQTEDLFKPW